MRRADHEERRVICGAVAMDLDIRQACLILIRCQRWKFTILKAGGKNGYLFVYQHVNLYLTIHRTDLECRLNMQDTDIMQNY